VYGAKGSGGINELRNHFDEEKSFVLFA